MKSLEIHDAQDHITEEAVIESSTTKVPAGTVLMVTRSGILRHTFPIAVTRREVALNQDIKGLTPYEGLLPDFIAHALRYLSPSILHNCAKDGTTVQSIDTPSLKRFEIPVAPLSEQRRIVNTIDELLSDLDAGVGALRQAQAKLKHYRAAVLKAAVDGQLTADWRKQNPVTESASELLKGILAQRRLFWEQEQRCKFAKIGKKSPRDWQSKYSEPIQPDTSDRLQLPAGWCWATVDQIGEIQGGLQKTPDRAPVSNHYPYLRVANVQRGRVDLKELSRFELTEQELRQLALRRGDLLVVEGNGSRTEIGRCALWHGEVENCVHQNHIIRIRLWVGIVPEYADLFLNSPMGQQEIQKVARSTSGLYTLSVSKIARLTLPLPTFSEQQAIADMVSEQFSMLDHLNADIGSKFAATQALKQSILHRAFTGQLVPQDPSDEPAEEILKRIAAKRMQHSNSTSRRRSRTR